MRRSWMILSGLLWIGMVLSGRAAEDPHKPNLDVSLYRRVYTPQEQVSFRLSAYNQKAIQLTLYRLNLPALLPNSKALEDLPTALKKVSFQPGAIARTWQFPLGKVYPDNWSEHEIKTAPLPPGNYLLQARGAGGREKRTWFSVSEIALVTKRSRQEVLVYATHAETGKPISGLNLTATDEKGQRAAGTTDVTGIWRTPRQTKGNLWLYGVRDSHPAFLLTGEPNEPDPYAVYTVTDRPVYRPGHRIQFKGTVRQRLEADVPGGITYRPYVSKPLVVEIRDATDALVSRRELTTNANGSYASDFQLASEPPLGNWQLITVIGEHRSYAHFNVLAYRKPEYAVTIQTGKPRYLGGEVIPVTIEGRYYFGQPVSGAAVTYQLNFFSEGSGSDDDSNAQPEPAYEGQGVTDSNGQLKLEVKTQRLPLNRRLSVVATMTDLSRRQQNGNTSVLITGGLFQLSLSTDKYLYRPKEQVRVTLTATDYDGKPVATPATVRLIETKYDSKRRPYKETTTRTVQTGADGRGTVTFTPPRPGYLRLEADAFDREQNKIRTGSYLWITGDTFSDYDYPTLNLIADRTTYRPGETATLLLNTSLTSVPAEKPKSAKGPQRPMPNTQRPVYALITIEGERLYRHWTQTITKPSSVLQIPLVEKYAPSIEVSVTLVQGKHIYQQQARLEVVRPGHELQVQVTPDKEKYQPGETASYTLTTRDYQGRAVPAELSLGIVDASIYAISADAAPDMKAFFYGGQENRISTDFSYAAQYSGGAYQTIAVQSGRLKAKTAEGRNGKDTPEIRVRRLFADTAYWNPFVATDADGTARLTFPLPDNLTTWRATARGLTLNTQVGSATKDVVSSLPLLVRLTLPRFYVDGDKAVVSVIVRNDTPETREVQTRIQATGATLEGETTRTVTLPSKGEQRLDWKAQITQPGRVKFLVTADGGPGGQDATELTLPVSADGLQVVEAKAEALTETNAETTLDLTTLPPGASVTLTLAPSLASAIFDGLEYLVSYPYGCAEQTASAFLPDVVVVQTLKRLGVTRKVHPDLEKWVNLGLQKLYRYQHGDGGWNWWEFDQTDGDMTAYVLSALLTAKRLGYLVDEQRILRGIGALEQFLTKEKEWNRRADWLLPLASTRNVKFAAPLLEIAANRDKLDTHGLASLCLALMEMKGVPPPKNGPPDSLEAVAGRLARELEAKLKVIGTTAYWPAEEGGYSWREDDTAVTAHALRALLTVFPQSPQVPAIVRWLMGHRVGKAWSSTKSSAEAVLALAMVMERSRELQPEFTGTVALDGEAVQTWQTSAKEVFETPRALTLSSEKLAGKKALTVSKRGPGVLYLTATTTYTVPSAQAKALNRGIAVRRTFHILAEDPIRAHEIPSGQEVEVEVELTADANYRYAILEDPIPAGCEVAPGDEQGRPYRWVGSGYARQEVHDNKVVFFLNDLPKGKTTFSYRLHTETPGTYRILPGIASLVYFPEIRGNTLPAQTHITERR